jgi:SNF2 family DNA or RNA helicase
MEIRVEKVGNRIHLRSPYHPDIPIKCHKINGSRWAKAKKVWTFPLDYGTCLRLREEFQHALVVGPKLREWAKEARQRHADLLAIASEISSDLEFVASVSPALATAMASRPYQSVGAAWLARARAALLGDHPGLGKTMQAMGAVVEAGITGPILVFAPKTAAIITWTDEVKKWLPNDMVWCVTALDGKKRDIALEQTRQYFDQRVWRDKYEVEPRLWVLCNIEMARCKPVFGNPDDDEEVTDLKPRHHGLFNQAWSSIIVDESHNALITKFSQVKKMTQQRAGMALLPARDEHLKIAMSGTPMRGRVYNLWGTLNWLRPDLYPSFWNWVKRYFEVYNDGYGFIIGELREDMKKQFYRDLESIMLRRTKQEVSADLPDKMYTGVRLEGQKTSSAPGHWLAMSSEQAASYAELEKHAAVQLEGGSLLANGALAQRTRLKQFASATWYMGEDGETPYPCRPSNKLDWIEQFLADRGILGEDEYGDGKVIIASQSTKLVNFIAAELQELGVKSHVLTGETSTNHRKEMVAEFQGEGGPRVFLLNTKAGGVSLTLDAADDVVILDELDDPDAQEQVEDRAHRISRMHQVMIHYVRSLDTIEVDIATDVGDKEHNQKALMDGRRNVKFEKFMVVDENPRLGMAIDRQRFKKDGVSKSEIAYGRSVKP